MKTFSVGPPETKAPLETGDMVSRRKILSRSRDDLTYIQNEEDVWYSKDKLVRVSKVFNYYFWKENSRVHLNMIYKVKYILHYEQQQTKNCIRKKKSSNNGK